MYEGLTKREIAIVKRHEAMTKRKMDAEDRRAEKRGFVVHGPMKLSEGLAALKEKRKKMVSMRLDPENIEGMKKRAKAEGIPYQTLINSVLHMFLNGELVRKVV